MQNGVCVFSIILPLQVMRRGTETYRWLDGRFTAADMCITNSGRGWFGPFLFFYNLTC